MKIKFCTISLLLVLSLSSQATLYTFSGTPTDNGAGPGGIPDNNTIGLSESQTLSGLPNSISAVTLNVTLSGGLGSDLTGYLRLGNLTGSPSVNLTGLPSGVIGANTPVSFDLSSTFSSLDPNNTWTLFFSDTSGGGQTTLNGWSLDITAVPEPVTLALVVFLVMLLALAGLRWAWRT